MITPVVVKVALAAVTDKPQLSETQHGNCPVSARAVIHFDVSGPVAMGDPETVFTMQLPRCL